jgi:hypothetical protein
MGEREWVKERGRDRVNERGGASKSTYQRYFKVKNLENLPKIAKKIDKMKKRKNIF